MIPLVLSYNLLLNIHPVVSLAISLTVLILLILSFAKKNKHNHNDNTSGVTGVFNIAAIAAENPELRAKCAFVLFDNEEAGLLGSHAFEKWRSKNYPGKKKSAVINLDCIANNGILLIAAPKMHEGLHKIADFMRSEGFETAKKRSSMIFLSDHAHFPGGVMLSFVKKSKLGYFYMPKIHTSKDNYCDLENIERLSVSVCRYISEIKK
jgi:Zn-dependent M28 family amino/carboxypeptidase